MLAFSSENITWNPTIVNPNPHCFLVLAGVTGEWSAVNRMVRLHRNAPHALLPQQIHLQLKLGANMLAGKSETILTARNLPQPGKLQRNNASFDK